jgi:hypothetical protein
MEDKNDPLSGIFTPSLFAKLSGFIAELGWHLTVQTRHEAQPGRSGSVPDLQCFLIQQAEWPGIPQDSHGYGDSTARTSRREKAGDIRVAAVPFVQTDPGHLDGVFLVKSQNSDYKYQWVKTNNKPVKSGRTMVEKREKHRRHYKPITRFPLNTQRGDLIASERRRIPTRRVNDIEVKELSCLDFIAELR